MTMCQVPGPDRALARVSLAASRGIRVATFDNDMNDVFEEERMATPALERQYGQHKEGAVAKAIERQTAKLPSDVFLWASIGSMATSLTLGLMGQKHVSLFVGQWAPTFLILGLYNKIVKELGSDRTEHAI